MRQTTRLFIVALTTFLVAGVAAAQDKGEGPANVPVEDRSMEFGFRGFWGDVYGRPDLAFTPALATAKLNEYSDIRNNFFLRRANIRFEDLFGRNYFNYRTQSGLYKNQSQLVSFGEYGRFKLQFRYEEIPHLYTNTAHTLYTETLPGVYSIPSNIKLMLQSASSTGTAAQINNSLPSFVATQVLPFEQSFVPKIQRRAANALFNYNLTPDWNIAFSFGREREEGRRPIGTILNSSPSASASSQPGTTANRQSPGTGEELPEPIDYVTKTLRAMTEYGKRNWTIQLGYNGSFFKSNIKSLLFDNPFATADIPVQLIPPGNGCSVSAPAVNCSIAAVPAHGRQSTYPDNHANYLNFAGAFNAGKHVRVMGSGSNGWLRQNEAFLPYTANSAITGLAPLPAAGLNGQKQTLAMNWTAVSKLGKNIQLEAKYRHYDYNNNTATFDLTPIAGDTIGANTTSTGQAAPTPADTVGRSNPGFNRKTLEFSGNYFFAKRSSAKLGWESEWFDRSHRDVAHSLENTVFAAVDYSPVRDLLLRVSGRHQDRKPDEYQDDAASDPVSGAEIPCTSTSFVFTEEQRCHRRFDEAARILNRGDVMLQYDLGRFSFGGTFQTIQSDFNRRGGSNSPVPLNFIAANTRPYFLYGAMNDLSWIYSYDTTYTFSPAISVFAEYTRENYYKRMISRNRTPTSGNATILTCGGCDTANNDWESTTRDFFDTFAGGLDIYLGSRFWFSPYYSLASGKGNVFSRALGDPTILSGKDQFVLTGTSMPESYPETTTRIHEVAAVFKFKLNSNLMPKVEYRYQQFDNRDYQTSPMTPYMGCVGAGAVVVGPPCVNVGTSLAVKSPSLYYPGFVVGDTAAARYLFLGADQPSYRVHIISATLEYRF